LFVRLVWSTPGASAPTAQLGSAAQWCVQWRTRLSRRCDAPLLTALEFVAKAELPLQIAVDFDLELHTTPPRAVRNGGPFLVLREYFSPTLGQCRRVAHALQLGRAHRGRPRRHNSRRGRFFPITFLQFTTRSRVISAGLARCSPPRVVLVGPANQTRRGRFGLIIR
jgi:hypothetical protein